MISIRSIQIYREIWSTNNGGIIKTTLCSLRMDLTGNYKGQSLRRDFDEGPRFYEPVAVHDMIPAPYALSLKGATSPAHIKMPFALLFTIFSFSLCSSRSFSRRKTRSAARLLTELRASPKPLAIFLHGESLSFCISPFLCDYIRWSFYYNYLSRRREANHLLKCANSYAII